MQNLAGMGYISRKMTEVFFSQYFIGNSVSSELTIMCINRIEIKEFNNFVKFGRAESEPENYELPDSEVRVNRGQVSK